MHCQVAAANTIFDLHHKLSIDDETEKHSVGSRSIRAAKATTTLVAGHVTDCQGKYYAEHDQREETRPIIIVYPAWHLKMGELHTYMRCEARLAGMMETYSSLRWKCYVHP